MHFISWIKSNLPSNKSTWKAFAMTAIPVIFSSFIFSLNSFVDNFMSINLPGGNQALAYANGWTELQIGIISATTIIGTALFSQYAGKQDWKRVREVNNLRMLFALGICLLFVIPSIAASDFMIQVISGFDKISDNIKQQAIDYLRIISVAWVLNAWAFTMVMIVRERNHGIVSFYSAFLTVLINVILNSIFIFGLKLNIIYLAISTIIADGLSIIYIMVWVWFKDRRIFINIFKIFELSPHVCQQFFKRIWSFLLFALGSITINIRFIFWNIGYPTGSIGLESYRLSSGTVLGITGMFFNIFWTTFESMSATVAVYVGKELGQNNIEVAKKNAKELQGFHIIVGFIIGLIALAVAFIAYEMKFLAGGYKGEMRDFYSKNPNLMPPNMTIEQIVNGGANEFLLNVRNSLIGIVVFIPAFVWYVSRDRIISVGGLTNLVATVEAIFGLFQIGWLCLICYVWAPLGLSFAWGYTIFFTSDILKLILYEIIYFKVNWAKNVTHANTID